MVLLLLTLSAAAAPLQDPTAQLVEDALRARGGLRLGGDPERDPLSLAMRLGGCGDDPLWAELLGAECAALRGEKAGVLAPRGGLGVGGLEPALGLGEPGAVSLRLSAEARGYWGPFELGLVPVLGQELGPASLVADLPEAWLGLRTSTGEVGTLQAGLGLRPRWRGPGQFGALLLSEAARPAPMGTLGWRSADLRGGKLAGEVGLGWLSGERGDVEHPGLLFVDLRYSPLPWVELGAGRMSIFGGEGRPAVNVGQLILPTEPHVYDDPDARLPDQDELAALDLRVDLPFGRLGGWGHPDRSLELWWEYGGEDVIGQESLGIPYPSLAGVANLGGGALHWGGLRLVGEQATILDDYFRWYTGHRVYHDGFTQDGRAMGHPAGGDAIEQSLLVGYLGPRWGVDLTGQRRQRVGVVGSEGEVVWALMEDEETRSLGLRGRYRSAGSRQWWVGTLTAARRSGAGFVPGTEETLLRASLGLR